LHSNCQKASQLIFINDTPDHRVPVIGICHTMTAFPSFLIKNQPTATQCQPLTSKGFKTTTIDWLEPQAHSVYLPKLLFHSLEPTLFKDPSIWWVITSV